VVAIVNVIKIFMTMLANKMYKNSKSFLMVILGSVIFAIACVILPNITDSTFIYVLSVIISISFPLFFISDCNSYAENTQEFSHKAMVIREICVHAFRPLIIVPFLLIKDLSYLIYLGVALAILMIFSAYYMLKRK